MAIYLFSYVFPFLLVVLLLGMITKKLKPKMTGHLHLLVNSCIAIILVITPVNGLPIGRWIYSINANVSMVLLALLLHKNFVDYLQIDLLGKTAIKTAWIYGTLAGSFLYPLAMGLGPMDPYEWGFSFTGLHIATMFFTLMLLFNKNRFGYALIAAVIGLNLGLLESINLWDYLIDPYLFLWSLGMGATYLTKKYILRPLAHEK